MCAAFRQLVRYARLALVQVSAIPDGRVMPRNTSRQATPPKPWTLAVYMIADGVKADTRLDQLAETTKDEIIGALEAAGASDRVNVAIQMDFKKTDGTRRIVARPGADWVRTSREHDAGDPKVLASFLRWVKRTSPADRYVVHFWGHSTGPVGLFFDQAQKGLRPDGLTLPELGYAMDLSPDILGQLVDIVLMKDCWLSTLEAACELRGGARFLVASQTEVPTSVWPYKELFECLSADDETATVASSLVDVLGDFYDLAPNRIDRLPEITFSAVNVEAVRAVDEPLRALAAQLDTMRAGPGGPASRLALRRSSRADPALVDVLTMCAKLGELTDAELRAHAADLSKAVAASVISHRPDPSAYQGLSALYFPAGASRVEQLQGSRISPAFFASQLDAAGDYRTLELSTHTAWDRIGLENYVPPPPPPLNAKGERIMPPPEIPDKSDTFSIDWSIENDDTLTVKVKRHPPALAAPKRRRRRSQRARNSLWPFVVTFVAGAQARRSCCGRSSRGAAHSAARRPRARLKTRGRRSTAAPTPRPNAWPLK